MEPTRIRSGSDYRRRQQQRKKKRNRLLALTLAAVLVVAGVILLLRGFSGGSGGASADGTSPGAVDPTYAQTVNTRLLDTVRTELNLQVGELCMLTLPSGTDIHGVTFASDNSGVVRVDSAGRLDALREGKANITAVSDSINAVCVCTVTAAPSEETSGDERLTTAYTANEDILAQNTAMMEIGEYLYSLTVNRRTNTVTAYTYDENGRYTVPVRAMVCSCGKGGNSSTPIGEYDIYYRDEWLGLEGNVYGQYISGFYGDFLFHSVPYYSLDRGDLKVGEFNKLGSNASEGCVRLMVSDVLWIYENCPVGTSVNVIDADASADPLGKPPAVRLDGSITWDPTDPDPENPFRGSQPAITGAGDTALKSGDSFDSLRGVKATDTCGNDITDRMTVAGTVLSDKPGVYYLTYTVTDDFGQTCEVTRTVTVG